MDKKIYNKKYKKKLLELQKELVRMQDWVIKEQKKIIIIFEGRDAAGKGGVIKRIAQFLNPRHCRIIALPAPTEKEKTQWYFQRYVQHFPSAGEIVIFDRSWYNRAGVERVMNFCTKEEYEIFLDMCPKFENMIINSGMQLIKYWFSVSANEQMKRFQSRAENVTKGWKLSPMDLESVKRWDEYSLAKDDMFKYTDTKHCPWYVVESDNKKKARINCINHLLDIVDYDEVPQPIVKLPKRIDKESYERPSRSLYKYVKEVF